MLKCDSEPWFALYVKPRHEKSVTAMLEGRGYDAFLPTYSHRVQNRKVFQLPLFPGYVFCRLNAAKKSPVLTIPGVFSIVGKGSVPELIPQPDIEAIRRVVESGLNTRPWPYLQE